MHRRLALLPGLSTQTFRTIFSQRCALVWLTGLFTLVGCESFQASVPDASEGDAQTPQDSALEAQTSGMDASGPDVRFDAPTLEATTLDAVFPEAAETPFDAVFPEANAPSDAVATSDTSAVNECGLTRTTSGDASVCSSGWDASQPSEGLSCAPAFASDRANCGSAGTLCSSTEYCARCRCTAQPPSVAMALRIDDDLSQMSPDEVSALAFGASGELYLAGTYDGTLRLGGRMLLTDPRGGLNQRGWVARVERDGRVAWALELGSSERNRRVGLAVGNDGNVYLSGAVLRFETGGIELPPLPMQRATGTNGVYVASLSPDGRARWIRVLSESVDLDFQALTVRPDGAVVVGARASVEAAFTRFDPVFFALDANTGCSLWKLRATHTPAQCAGGVPGGSAWSVETLAIASLSNSGDNAVLAAGWGCGSLEVGCRRLNFQASSFEPSAGSYVLRIDRNGNVTNTALYNTVPIARSPPGARIAQLTSGSSDSAGNGYFAGRFASNLSLGSTTLSLRGLGNPFDVFVTSLAPDGNAGTFSRTIYTADNDGPPVLAADAHGALAVAFTVGGSISNDSFGAPLRQPPTPGGTVLVDYFAGQPSWSHSFEAVPTRPPQATFPRVMARSLDGWIAVVLASRTGVELDGTSAGTALFMDENPTPVLAATASSQPLNAALVLLRP